MHLDILYSAYNAVSQILCNLIYTAYNQYSSGCECQSYALVPQEVQQLLMCRGNAVQHSIYIDFVEDIYSIGLEISVTLIQTLQLKYPGHSYLIYTLQLKYPGHSDLMTAVCSSHAVSNQATYAKNQITLRVLSPPEQKSEVIFHENDGM